MLGIKVRENSVFIFLLTVLQMNNNNNNVYNGIFLYELFRLFFFHPFPPGSVESDEFSILTPFLALKKRRERRKKLNQVKAREDKPKEDGNTITHTTFALFSRRRWKNNRRPKTFATQGTGCALRGKLLIVFSTRWLSMCVCVDPGSSILFLFSGVVHTHTYA